MLRPVVPPAFLSIGEGAACPHCKIRDSMYCPASRRNTSTLIDVLTSLPRLEAADLVGVRLAVPELPGGRQRGPWEGITPGRGAKPRKYRKPRFREVEGSDADDASHGAMHSER